MRSKLLICLAALTAGGCGAQAETAPPLGVTTSFFEAVTAGQGARACALLAPRTATKLSGDGESCSRAVLRLGSRDARAERVSVWGAEAQVRLRGDTVFLHRYADGWRIKAAGCEPRPPEPYDCDVED
jgi:hypothetical protein